MATKKSAAKKNASRSASKSASKSSAKSNRSQQQPAVGDDKLSKEAIQQAKDTPIGGNVLGNEPLGPGVEHEDHEGGLTDSLARRGVRYIPNAEEKKKLGKPDKARVFGAPSVRERQTAPFAQDRPAKADVVSRVEKANKKKTEKTVVVIAKRRGFYPADGRLRHRGDVFEYTLLPGDKGKLPSWVEDRDGKLESREPGETSAVFDNEPAATLKVSKRGEVTQV